MPESFDIPAPDLPEWWPSHLAECPPDAVWPRVMTPIHSRAVGTYGPAVAEHALTYGVRLRWWQEFALSVVLVHDAAGELCWPEAAISTARQLGKGFGVIRPYAEWRSEHPALFGEPQNVVHISHQINTVMEIATPGIARARDLGHRVRLTNGEQVIERPDGSRWMMRTTSGAYGFSASAVIVDEVWAIVARVLDSMVRPMMLAKQQPQLLLTSTANKEAKPTYKQFRASSGETFGRCVVEWSAPDVAWDRPDDERFWRMASPHWTEQRERTMRMALEGAVDIHDFAANFLNVWPPEVEEKDDRDFALPGWEDAGDLTIEDPGTGGIACIDESLDASRFGMLVLLEDRVFYREARNLGELVARANAADEVVVGLTLVDSAARAGITKPLTRYGRKETGLATPLLLHTARGGRLKHNAHPAMIESAKGAVVYDTEAGKTLSAKRSSSDILPVKLLAWSLHYQRHAIPVAPAVW